MQTFKNVLRRLLNSPLRIFGLLTILFGVLTTILSLGYLIVLGLIFIGTGSLVYLIDYLINKYIKDGKVVKVSQFVVATGYIIFAFVSYMKWQECNFIVFPKNFKGQAGIIFGMEGYPKLPETEFWKKTINIPASGILITSTRVEEISRVVRFVFVDGSNTDYQRVDWNPNFEVDCIVCDSRIKSWIFKIDESQSSSVKDKMTTLCNEIALNQKKSNYKSEYSALVNDDKGKYLDLQDKGLTSLPNNLSRFNIYKVILTNNDFKEIPRQILEISTLEEIVFAVNPIQKFPCNLSDLKRLKSISFAATKIKDIDCDLSQLDSLQEVDLSRNGLDKLPKSIKTIPNLIWLSLDDNNFTDIGFINENLGKLETLYLYTNKIKSISRETEHLRQLKKLLIFDNEIDRIPDNISELKSLEVLEIWDNPIKYISPKISELKKLKSMRIDEDNLTEIDKNNLRKWLPNCELNFQTRGNKTIQP